MQSPSARVAAWEADGTSHPVVEETPEEEALRGAAALVAEQAGGSAAPSGGEAAAAAAAARHADAADAVLRARAELEPLLDVISHLESGAYISQVQAARHECALAPSFHLQSLRLTRQ